MLDEVVNLPIPTIKLGGAAVSRDFAARIRRIEVNRAINRAGWAEVVFEDDRRKPLKGLGAGSVGDDLEVAFEGAAGTDHVVFKGVVTGFTTELSSAMTGTITLQATDLAFKLDSGPHHEAYLNATAIDIIKKIAGAVGLRLKVPNFSSAEKWDHYLQTVSHRDLLDDFCRRLGAYWFVNDKELCLVDTAKVGGSSTEVTHGVNLLELWARHEMSQAWAEVTVRDWDPAQQKAVVGKGPGGVDLDGVDNTKIAKDKPATILAHGRTVKEAQGQATALLNSARRGSYWGQAVMEFTPTIELCTDLKVGSHHGADGVYLITGLQHTWQRGHGVTVLALGGDRHRDLADLVLDRSPLASWAERGPVVGTVSNIEDPDMLGRVKVRFPQVSEQLESDWARVLVTRAGKDGGAFHSLAVSDEVMVMFEAGDMRRPVVIGGVWSSKVKPDVTSSKEAQMETTYLSTPDGSHTLKMVTGASKNGSAELSLTSTVDKLKGNLTFKDGDEPKATLEVDEGELKIRSGKTTVTIDKNGNLKIDADGNVDIESKKDVTIKGANITLAAKSAATVKGATLALESKGVADLKASGATNVKGSVVNIN